MLRKGNYILLLAILVALISLVVYYAAHVEYFKAFPIVFVIVFSLFTLRRPILAMQKLMNISIFVILGSAMFLIAMVLWR
jgi:hypothetical protein